MTDKARFLKQSFCSTFLGPTALNETQNENFCHFIEFGLLVFLEITYDDRLQQYLTFRRGGNHEKILGHKSGPSKSELDPKLWFLPFPQVYFISFQ